MRLWCLSLLFLIVSCAQIGDLEKISSPLKIISFTGFSDAEITTLKEYTQDLNKRANKNIFDDNGTYEVTLTKAPNDKDKPTLAGTTRLTENGCEIKLMTFLFEAKSKNQLPSIFFHETGHCAGLKHTDTPHSIMSPVSIDFSNYTDEDFEKFFTDLKSNLTF